MNQKELGNKIAQRRKELGMTQTVLAEKLQVTNKAVSKWETGEGYPDITLIKRLSLCLDMSLDDLLGDHQTTQVSEDVMTHKDIKNIQQALIHSMMVLSFFLPFASYEGVIFGNEVIPNIKFTLTGFQLLGLSVSNIQTGFIVFGLYVMIITSFLKAMHYSNFLPEKSQLSNAIINQKTASISRYISLFSLIMVGISTHAYGPHIGYILLCLLWCISFLHDFGFRFKGHTGV